MALRLLEPPVKDLPLLRKPVTAPGVTMKPSEDFLSMQTKAGKLPSYLSEKPSILRKLTGSIMQTNPVESMARESAKLDYIQKYKQKFGTEPLPQEVSSFEEFYREGKAKEPILKQAELPLTLAAGSFAAARPLMNIPKIAAFSGIQALNPIGKIKTENQTGQDVRDVVNMITSGGLTEGAFKLPAKIKTARMEGVLSDVAKNISAIEKGLSETVKNSPVFQNFWNTLSPRGKALQVVRAAETNPAVGDVVKNILSRESSGRKQELMFGKKGEAKLPLPEEKPKVPRIPPIPAPAVPEALAAVPPVAMPKAAEPVKPNEFVYHGTTEGRARQIAQQGLLSGREPKGEQKIKFERKGDAVGKEYHETIYAVNPKTNEKLGYVDVAYLGDNASVKMVEVTPGNRRKGIATQLLNEVQKNVKNPIEILGDVQTPEGKALFDKFKQPITAAKNVGGGRKEGIIDPLTQADIDNEVKVAKYYKRIREIKAELDKKGITYFENAPLRELESKLKGQGKQPLTAAEAVKQGMGAEGMQEVYNLSWNNLSKKVPENYDKLVIPEIEKTLQNVKGDVIRNKIYNYIIYEFNKGKSEGILDSINISSSEGTKKVYYKISDKKIDVKLLSEYEAAKKGTTPAEPPKTTVEQPEGWEEPQPIKPSEPQSIEDRAEMEIEIMSYANGLHPLEKAMRDIGRIRVQAGGKEAEESRDIPKRFISKEKGRPIDERRQELENKYGIVFESDGDLRQALKELGDKQQRFLLSSDVQQYLKSKPNIEALGRKLGKKISPAAYKRIIYSNVGLKPSATPMVSTKEKMFKYVLKQREIAARGGFKAGRRELKTEIRGKKAERARMLEAAQRFPREQRYEIYKAARKAGLILPEKKDPTGKVVQNYKNKLSPLLRFYKNASFDEIMNYIRALRGDPENPPLVFKLSGDPTADAETMKLIAEASEGWQDINRMEIASLDLPRIVEKVSGLEVFDENILADNTYEVLKGADDARFERMNEELQNLEDGAKEFSAETKASAELMRKFEVGENLSEKEQKAADFLRSKYDELIKQANENRERLGKKPIPYRKDYMTHIRDWNLLTSFFKGDQKIIDNLTNEQWQALAKGQYAKISVPFNQFALKREGPRTKYDAIGNYKKYLETILYEIYMSPAIKHARVFTDYALLKQPNAKIAMDNLLDELAGKPSSFDHIAIRPIVSNPVLKALNARFGANALIGNVSYYLMNASNIATASGELGNYTIKGMHGFLSNPYLRQLAFQKSSLLKSRQGLFDYEIHRLEAFTAGHGKDLTAWENIKLKDKQLEYLISSINRIIEYNNVGSSWVGAYLKAIDKFKYSPEKAYKYADSVARKTQGGYRPYEMPGWMRSDSGKIVSKFGTWAFNMYNYFFYDLGVSNIPGNIASVVTKAPRKKIEIGKLITLIVTLMVVNDVYRRMGLRKPYGVKSFIPPTPLTRGRYEQPPAGRILSDIQTITPKKVRELIPIAEQAKHRPETKAKAAEELFFMLAPRYGGAQMRRLFHGDILPQQKKKSERKTLRLLNSN